MHQKLKGECSRLCMGTSVAGASVAGTATCAMHHARQYLQRTCMCSCWRDPPTFVAACLTSLLLASKGAVEVMWTEPIARTVVAARRMAKILGV